MENKKDRPLIGGPDRLSMLLSVLLFIPLLMSWFIFVQRTQALDDYLLQSCSRLIVPGLTRFMKAVTFLGSHAFLIPANLVLIIFFLFRKDYRSSLQTLLIALSSLGMMSLLKNLFQRIRPSDPLVPGITNYSFPSGHAMMSVAFFGWLIWLLLQQMKQGPLRKGLIFFLTILILTIGFSRVYLRVHYPSDVLAGYCIGIFWISCCLWIFRRLRLR